MKSLLILFLTIVSLSSTAQIRYEEGYFINHENITTKCLIHHVDWLNNPTTIKYRLQPEGDILTAGLSQIKEFGVAGLKFLNTDVRVDTTARETKNIDDNRNPEWKDMQVFLKVLTEGKASLYSYRTPEFEVFFYSVDGSPAKQLVYKEFLTQTTSSQNATAAMGINKNLTYVQQLKTDVSCGVISDANLKRVAYHKTPLLKHFEKFNVCHGGVVLNRSVEQKVRIYINPGLDFSNFKLSDDAGFERKYEKSTTFRLGVMAEYIFPFNNGKWSMMIEPTYQSYTSGDVVNYRSVELPLGVRHNFFLSQSTKIFLNGFMVLDLPLKYDVKWTQAITYEGNQLSASFAVGTGINFNRFSLEARKYFSRSILGRNSGLFFVHEKISFIVGFRIK